MKKALKIVLCIVMILLGIVTCTVVNVVRGVGEIANEYKTPPTGQQVQEITTHGALIAARLQPRYEVVLEGVELCLEQTSVDARTTNSLCGNGICESRFYFGDRPMPRSITISRKQNGTCVRETIADVMPHVKLAGYASEVLLDEAMLKQMGIADASAVQRTAHSTYADTTQVRFSGHVRVWLSYKQQVARDEFLIDQVLVQLHYGAAQ